MLWWQWVLAAAFPLSIIIIGLVVSLWKQPSENDEDPDSSNP